MKISAGTTTTEFHRNKKNQYLKKYNEELQRNTKKFWSKYNKDLQRKTKKISGANTIGNVRVGATRPQLTFLPTPQLNCALHQKHIRVDESTTNGKAENIVLLHVLRIYLLPLVNSVYHDIDFSRRKKTLSIRIASGFTKIYRIDYSLKDQRRII